MAGQTKKTNHRIYFFADTFSGAMIDFVEMIFIFAVHLFLSWTERKVMAWVSAEKKDAKQRCMNIAVLSATPTTTSALRPVNCLVSVKNCVDY